MLKFSEKRDAERFSASAASVSVMNAHIQWTDAPALMDWVTLHSSIISSELKESFAIFLHLSLLGKISLISENLSIDRKSESWQGGSRKRGNEDDGQKYFPMPAGMVIFREFVECYETKMLAFAALF